MLGVGSFVERLLLSLAFWEADKIEPIVFLTANKNVRHVKGFREKLEASEKATL